MLKQTFVVVKELDGDQQHGRNLSTEPSSIFKLAAANAIKCTNKDRERKTTAAAKPQHKKAQYSVTEIDTGLSSRMAYSR